VSLCFLWATSDYRTNVLFNQLNAKIGLLLLLSGGLILGQGSGRIKGKVREAGGKALSGVAIRAVNAGDPRDVHETHSDSSGDFVIDGLGAADYQLTFTMTGYKAFQTRKLEVKSGDQVQLRKAIELEREREPYAVVRGAVFRGDGYSLPDAKVTIERLGEGKRLKRETVSTSGGEFAFRLPAGKATYRVTAIARGFAPTSKDVDIENDDVRQVALQLQPPK
jgi:hypothetical protein